MNHQAYHSSVTLTLRTRCMLVALLLLLPACAAMAESSERADSTALYLPGEKVITYSEEDRALYQELYENTKSEAPQDQLDNMLAWEGLATGEFSDIFGLPAEGDIPYESALWLTYATLQQEMGLSPEELALLFPQFVYIIGDTPQPYWQVRMVPLVLDPSLDYEPAYFVDIYAQDGTLRIAEFFRSHG